MEDLLRSLTTPELFATLSNKDRNASVALEGDLEKLQDHMREFERRVCVCVVLGFLCVIGFFVLYCVFCVALCFLCSVVFFWLYCVFFMIFASLNISMKFISYN